MTRVKFLSETGSLRQFLSKHTRYDLVQKIIKQELLQDSIAHVSGALSSYDMAYIPKMEQFWQVFPELRYEWGLLEN